MGDATNNYETLDRSLKKIGIILVDDSGFLRNGKSLACVDLLRKLLLSTSVPTAKLLLQRGCPSHAPDRKLVAAAFDLVRDKIKFLPSLTVDQFFKEGYAAHKLAILVKLTGYISETDKAFAKAQPPKMMYVVPSEPSQTSASFKYEESDPDLPEPEHESSLLDDVDVEVSYTDLPPAPASNPRHSTSSMSNTNNTHSTHSHYVEPKAWPQTDFIKKHILDNTKLQNMNNSPARITAPKSRSTTPTSTRRSGSSSSSMYGVDVYDIEEKTAALEAIQALRASRSGITTTSNTSNNTHNTISTTVHTSNNNANYNHQSPNKYTTFSAESSPVFKNNNTLTELAAADISYNTTANTNTTSTNNTHANYNNASGGANSADFQQFVQYTVDQAVASKIEHDPVVQKLIDQRVEAVVEQRVSAAVQELTTKYDFIINKLVAAVDAEFTLLNNKLAMQQQQQPLGEQY